MGQVGVASVWGPVEEEVETVNQFRNFAIWIVIGLLLLTLFSLFQGQSLMRASAEEVTYSQFIKQVNDGTIKSVTYSVGGGVTGDIIGKTGDNKVITTFGVLADEDLKILRAKNVDVQFRSASGDSIWSSALIYWLPTLLIIGVWVFLMRQMQSGSGKAMGFGKSRAKLLTEKQGRVTFDDVAGVDEAKDDVVEIVDFLKDPHKFQRLGGKIPRGALLVGPPGTGKTLLARAIAGEANVPFFTISGSDFVEMFVGVGASRVRDMFEQAKKNAPCIVFIDEIDAVGRHRGAGLGGGNDEREQTLNQLLVEMDGFEPNEGVIIIAATNRPDVLDPALLRPGRFDRQITVGNPDVKGREQILKVHMKDKPLAPDIDAKILARGTPGFSGADLANLCNEAALLAARRNKRMITQAEFEDAKDKVMMGAERKSMVMSEEERRNTAYHEAGHALVGLNVKYDPLHKVTIVPRGRALGLTMNLPDGDRYSRTREWCEARLAVLFGGREAELILGGEKNVTNGAMGDIQMATALARSMITEWGMSDKLGRVRYSANEQEIFLGHSVAQSKNVSEGTASVIDDEVRRLVQDGEATAKAILKKKRNDLHVVAKALLEYETLSGEDVATLLKGKPLNREDEPSGKTGGKGNSKVPRAGARRGGLEPQTQS
jgi:cell division protease FtsH